MAKCALYKRSFDLYESASDQAINYDKFDIFFSRNTTPSNQNTLSSVLGVHVPLSSVRCLGLSSMVGRSKKSVFKHFRERLWD